MKKKTLLFSTAMMMGFALSANLSAETTTLNHDDERVMFYDDLLPYGEWIEAEPGVIVWRPRYIHRDWQPYSEGRWAWTRHGWYWVSNEPFGWAVFHYGRWSMHSRFGWVWHPGRVWGPAWVEWRYSDAYIGWAPLPPAAIFHVTFGIRFTRHWVAPASSWCFVRYRTFGSDIRHDRLLPRTSVQRMIGSTRRGRSASIDRNEIINRGVDREVVERRGSFRVDRMEVRSGSAGRSEEIRNGRIETYRPEQDRRRSDVFDRPARPDERRVTQPRETDSKREFTRPGQVRRDSPQHRDRPVVQDRKVTPPARMQPGRRPTSPPTRSPDRSSGRKRDTR